MRKTELKLHLNRLYIYLNRLYIYGKTSVVVYRAYITDQQMSLRKWYNTCCYDNCHFKFKKTISPNLNSNF